MKAWWISWYAHPEDGPFELHTPWWISGHTIELADASRDVIVAAIPAETEEEAWEIVETAYDEPPQRLERRFCDQLEDKSGKPNIHEPWSGDGGRFPRRDWMKWPA